jgi:hypothetical protein
METPDSPETLVLKPHEITALVFFGTAALIAVFTVLAIVRVWASRLQKKPVGCGGLDIAGLRRLRDAGEITQEEFDAVCGAAGGPDAPPRPARSGAAPETPIDREEAGGEPERSRPNGQE